MKGSPVCSVLILLSVVSASLAAAGLGPATVHESHPNQCYNDKSAKYYSPGDSWPMQGTCGKVTCEKMSSLSSTKLMTSFVTCGKAMVAPPCYMTEEDLTKAYPDCCPQPVCPETNNDDAFILPLTSSEENLIPSNNDVEAEESFENDVAGHFSLGGGKNTKMVDNNDLEESQEELEPVAPAASSVEPSKKVPQHNFVLRMPIELPPPKFADVSSEEEVRANRQSKVYDENQSFELRLPKEPSPPTFHYADIDNDHEDDRLNEVDDFQWV